MRRRFQFSLRRLLISTGLLCLALAFAQLSLMAEYSLGRLLAFPASWAAFVTSVTVFCQLTLRKLFLANLIAQCCLPVYAVFDVGLCGPQVIMFNNRCERIVRSRGLIGKTSEEVQAVLGEPTSWYDQGPGHFTLNYCPHPFIGGAQFQAHFTEDKLVSTELYDF